jgi:hypothetical protein
MTARCAGKRTKHFGVAEFMNMKMEKITLDAELFNDLLAIAKILHEKADGLNPEFLKNSGRVIAECERVFDAANYQKSIKIAQHLIVTLRNKMKLSPKPHCRTITTEFFR